MNYKSNVALILFSLSSLFGCNSSDDTKTISSPNYTLNTAETTTQVEETEEGPGRPHRRHAEGRMPRGRRLVARVPLVGQDPATHGALHGGQHARQQESSPVLPGGRGRHPLGPPRPRL